jgi:lactate 2-monooxygenase
MSRKPPQPLGTVDPEEIERRAKEKLKDHLGKFQEWEMHAPYN